MWFTQCSSSLREARTGAQGRNWRRAHCFLAYFPWLDQLAFFYTSQDHQPRGNTSHSRLKPVTSIVNQENDPHTERERETCYRLIRWRHFPVWGSLSQNDSGLCQVDKTKNKQKTKPTNKKLEGVNWGVLTQRVTRPGLGLKQSSVVSGLNNNCRRQ